MAVLVNNSAFAGSGTVTTNITATTGNVLTAVFTTPTQPGTVQLFHVDSNAVEHSLGPAVAVLATEEDIHVVAFPINHLRIKYVNTNATPGTVLIEAYAEARTR